MIKHSPESPMPEPYKTYIAQRAESIGRTLAPVAGDTDVQLCSRAITSDERLFDATYGCVVADPADGLKSVLYRPEFGAHADGIVTQSPAEARAYATELLQRGDRIRVKDPAQSDGDGQFVVAGFEELDAITDHPLLRTTGLVLMPEIARITGRFSIGRINLGRLWRLSLRWA